MYTYEEVYQKSLEYFNGDELAAKVFVDKYSLCDLNGNYHENTPDKTFRRLAKEFAEVEKNKFKIPYSEDEIYSFIKDFKYIVPQGGLMFGIGNPYQYVSLSNCFVLTSPNDSYGGIMSTDTELVQISKRRGGVGIDISNLRPTGTPTQNAAKTSTGIVSFMERYSNSINEVGQSGRRGALMLTINVHHPDILNFVTVKRDLSKVTGANISVKLTNEFLNAVKNDKEYELRFPVDAREKNEQPKISKMISAREVWNEIVKNAHAMAEPGILFWDNIIENSPADCYIEEGFKTVSTNPCVVGDTLVFTNIGWIKIKKLNEYKENFPNLKIITRDRNGIMVSSELEWVGITKEKSELIKISFENDEFLLTTPDHKLYDEHYNQIEVKNFKINDKIIGANNRLLKIVNIENVQQKEDVWDLTANPNYNFFSIYGYDEKINHKKYKIEHGSDDSVEFLHKYDILSLDNNYFITELYDDKDTVQKDEILKIFNKSILSVDCGEIPLCEMDSCRLMVLNLYSFVDNPFTEKTSFNFDRFEKYSKIAMRLMDDLIDLEIKSLNKIIEKIKSDPQTEQEKQFELNIWEKIILKAEQGRRTGLGITALGDAIAALGIGYATEKGIEMTEQIYKKLKYSAYFSSVEMAKELGPFPIWNHEKEKNNNFLLRIKNEFPDLYSDMKKYGRRNIALLTTAPVGSISILTGTTSGTEPQFMLSYTRRKKINEGDVSAKVDFIDQNGVKWQEFKVYAPKLKEWMRITGETDETKSPWFGYCAEDINWTNKIKMQAVAQQQIDHSISNTTNLPEDVSVEEVKKIYETAWETGCKGVTIYRKNSRSGVLVDDTSKKHEEIQVTTQNNNATKRPTVLPAEVHHFKIKGKQYYVTVGLLDGKPYEIFVGESKENEEFTNDEKYRLNIPKKITNGEIKKVKRGFYVLLVGDDKYKLNATTDDDSVNALTRMISTSLRHHVDVVFVVQQLEKIQGFDNFPKALAKALKKYIVDGTFVSGENCPNCGGSNMVRQNGCVECMDCGMSRC